MTRLPLTSFRPLLGIGRGGRFAAFRGNPPRLMDDIMRRRRLHLKGDSVYGTWIHDLQLLIQGLPGLMGPAFMFMLFNILFEHFAMNDVIS